MMAMSCLAGLGSPLYVVYASPLSFSVFRFFLTHSLSNRSRFHPFLRVLVPSSAILETDSGHMTMPRVECLLHLRKFLFNTHLQFRCAAREWKCVSTRNSREWKCVSTRNRCKVIFLACWRLSPFCTKVFNLLKLINQLYCITNLVTK